MRRASSGLSCLLAIDKPEGLTSHDVVARVRRALGERRVGHAGTLDPAATGVLVVGVGQATRLLGQLTLDEKSYEAWIAFGTETSTDDAEGEVVRQGEVAPELFDAAFAGRCVAGLAGECDQVPPAYSAVSVDGRRAYARARAGEEVKLEPRHVTIMEARLVAVEGDAEAPVWHCYFRVSKGTYIRALARDLGRSLGSAAYLAALRRCSSGSVGLDACMTLDELAELGASGIAGCELDPARALGLPVRLLDAIELADVACGRRLSAGMVLDIVSGDGAGEGLGGLRAPAVHERVSLVCGTRLYGIWEERGGRLAADVNFPEGVAGVRP